MAEICSAAMGMPVEEMKTPRTSLRPRAVAGVPTVERPEQSVL